MRKLQKYLGKAQRYGKRALAIALAGAMITTSFEAMTVSASSGDWSANLSVQQNAVAVGEQIEAEGIVLLENSNVATDSAIKMLPLTDNKKVNVFGTGSIDPFYGGGGSGDGKIDTSEGGIGIDFYEGLSAAGISYNTDLHDLYQSWYTANGEDGTSEGTGGAAGQLAIAQCRTEMPATELTDSVMDAAKDYSDIAVVMISRSGSESADLTVAALQLQEREIALLEKVTADFTKVIVLFNIDNVQEMGWLQDGIVNYQSTNIVASNIKAAAIIGAPGEAGMTAVGKMLTGAVNPSGRLADTIAYHIADHPSTTNFGDYPYTTDGSAGVVGEITNAWGQTTQGYTNGTGKFFVQYEEGIYVGYRYFETFAPEKVQYPFGYGLSYTDFVWDVESINVTSETVTATVKVTNNGSVAGKDVVEVYFQAPYTTDGIEKSAIELGGYEKTGIIEPDSSETVTVTFDTNDMSSYSMADEGWVMDAGNYTIKVGKSVRDIVTDEDNNEVYNVASKTVMNQDDATGNEIKNRFDDIDGGLTFLSRSDEAGTYPTSPSSYAETDAVTNSDVVPEATEGTTPLIGQTYDKVITLQDVNRDNTLWDKFLDQLTLDEMITMIADCGFKTAAVDRLGIPATVDNDGPASIKGAGASGYTMSGLSYPSETVLACTWNDDLAQMMGDAVGKEAAVIGTNVWYGPATNTHRSPMGGRNFEYYSEDPLLAGKMTAAVVKGAQGQGLIPTVKHFAVNDQETNRDSNGIYTYLSEQALREIYLKSFEIAVKEGGSFGIMSSFNRVGTVWAGGSTALMTDVLRNEWGFKGFVVTDYYLNFTGSGYMSPILAVYAQNDAFLTGMYGYQESILKTAMTNAYNADPVGFGTAMRKCVKNLCTMKMQTKAFDPDAVVVPVEELTYTSYVEGFDWGPGVTKIVVDLKESQDVSAYTAENVTVAAVKQGFFGNNATGNRTVTNVYASDEDGTKVNGTNSRYVAVEMSVSPADDISSPFFYDFMSGFNTWADPYTYTITLGSNIITTRTDVVAPTADQFKKGTSTYENITLSYGSYAPAADSGKNPLVIWLHGAGEGGTDADISILGNNVTNLISSDIQTIFGGAYVLTPQSPTVWMDADGTGSYGAKGTSYYTKALMNLIETYVKDNADIDANRIYIGGCSNGGFMTINMLKNYPDYFAAAFPICEAYPNDYLTDADIENMKDIPIWFTHAQNDPTVVISQSHTENNGYYDAVVLDTDANGNYIPIEAYSRAAYNRLKAAGASNVHFSLFKDVQDTSGKYTVAGTSDPYQYNGHWSWIYTLNNECTKDYDGTNVQVNGKNVTIMEWLSLQTKSTESGGSAYVPVNGGTTDTGNKTDDKTDDKKDDTTTPSLPKKNEVVKQSGAKYKVTKSDAKSGTVTYVAPTNLKKTKVVIPDKVTIDGTSFKVTSVAAGAFRNNDQIIEVTVGKNVKTIGANAFKNCDNLETVTVTKNVKKIGAKAFAGSKSLSMVKLKTNKLTSIGDDAFKGIAKDAVIKVPELKYDDYKEMIKDSKIKASIKIKKY